jgi:hypothetical protein
LKRELSPLYPFLQHALTHFLETRAQFFKDFSLPFYGYNRPGAQVSEGVRESFWEQGMMAGFAIGVAEQKSGMPRLVWSGQFRYISLHPPQTLAAQFKRPYRPSS